MPPKNIHEVNEPKKPFCTSIHPTDERHQHLADSINRGNGYVVGDKLNVDEGIEGEGDFSWHPDSNI